MRIEVVSLKIERNYYLEIDTDVERIFGVEDSAPIFCNAIGCSNLENVALLCLDNTNKIINFSIISIGNIDNVKVSISQIVKIALLCNSSKVILSHNHPSGVLEITNFDIEMTKKIGMILKFLDIILIDSLVVSDKRAISIREKVGEIDRG